MKKNKSLTAEINEPVQKVILSAKDLKELGYELTNIMNILEMNNVALDGLEVIKNKDRDSFMWLISKYISATFEQNQRLYDRLDKVSFLLLENDNKEELETCKN